MTSTLRVPARKAAFFESESNAKSLEHPWKILTLLVSESDWVRQPSRFVRSLQCFHRGWEQARIRHFQTGDTLPVLA
jgi:hypothetical protein